MSEGSGTKILPNEISQTVYSFYQTRVSTQRYVNMLFGLVSVLVGCTKVAAQVFDSSLKPGTTSSIFGTFLICPS